MPRLAEALPEQNIAQFVDAQVTARGLSEFSSLNAFAQAISSLLGDDVELDKTGRQLAALHKAGVIDGAQMARLLTLHLREIRAAKSQNPSE